MKNRSQGRKIVFKNNSVAIHIHTHTEEHSRHLHRQRMTENISLKCTVLARDTFYQILLQHLEAKLKVAELIIIDIGHKRILQKTLHQIQIQKLTYDQNKQNVAQGVAKRTRKATIAVRQRSTYQPLLVSKATVEQLIHMIITRLNLIMNHIPQHERNTFLNFQETLYTVYGLAKITQPFKVTTKIPPTLELKNMQVTFNDVIYANPHELEEIS